MKKNNMSMISQYLTMLAFFGSLIILSAMADQNLLARDLHSIGHNESCVMTQYFEASLSHSAISPWETENSILHQFIDPIQSCNIAGNSSLLEDASPVIKGQIAEPDPKVKARISADYGKLPLSFIVNQGQVNAKVAFYETGPEHTTFFTNKGIVIGLQVAGGKGREAAKPASVLDKTLIKKHPNPQSSHVKIDILGMNKDVLIVPEGRQPGKVNYFIGSDPHKWHTNIFTYKSVLYRDAYPGIDLRFYGNNRKLEYDIIVKPGADPSKVKFQYVGAKEIHLTKVGDLVIQLKGGQLIQKKPIIYQKINGKRVMCKGNFSIREDNSICIGDIKRLDSSNQVQAKIRRFTCSFHLASYQKDYPLIIDPVIVYSTYLGGNSEDEGCGIAVDSSGNAYVTGETQSSDFSVKNALYPNCGGETDVFVTKINASGTAIVYSTYLGGSSQDWGSGIATDSSGNAYVTGYTYSSDFPTGNALYPNYPGGGSNAFVTKINANGTALIYSTYLGGSSSDWGYGIATDSSGNAYVTGKTISSDFPTKNALYLGGYIFVTKINSDGRALVYSTHLGGIADSTATSIAADSSGNAYVTGYTFSSDFPTKNAIYSNLWGECDAFVTKINASGTALVYSTYLGGSSSDWGFGIAVDSSGNAYVTGDTHSSDFPTENPLYPNLGIEYDGFVTKINSSGTALVYSTFLGGKLGSGSNGIAVDGSGNAYVTQCAGLSEINAGGTAFIYSTCFGKGAGNAIAVDDSGSAYITGIAVTSDFPTKNAIYPNSSGGWDAFVTKISAAIPATYYYGQSSNSGYTVEPVNTALGNYAYKHIDLKIPGRGLGLEISRSYNSQDSYNGPLGYGWTYTYNMLLAIDGSGNAVVKYPDGHQEAYTVDANGTFTPNFGGIYNTLVQNSDATYTLTDKAGTGYHFSATGKLNTIIDKNGNTITLSYTGANLTTITDPAGRSLSLAYDVNGHLTQVTDPMGQTLSYAYDTDGNLTSYTDARGGVWHYSYDASHEITEIKNPAGNVLVANTYTSDKVVSQTNGRGYTTTFQYDTPNPGQTTITDPLGNVTIHTHDGDHRLIKDQDALGNTISYSYDANGNRTEITDKNGNVTRYIYDVRGNVISKTDALGNTTTITYDAANNPTIRTDALGNITGYAYDSNGNLKIVPDPLGNVTTYTYDDYGDRLSKTDANGSTTNFTYDAKGNLTEVKDALNGIVSYTYDPAGRMLSRTDAKDNTTTYSYDANNNLISITDPLGHTITYTYDANNNQTSVTDKNGNRITTVYDVNDEPVSITDPLGNKTTITYDALDRTSAVADPNGGTISYNYDGIGNLVKMTNALGSTTTYTYDANGNRLTTTNPLGKTTRFAYDALNRLTKTTDPLGNVITRTYDALGRLKSLTNANRNQILYAYDALGRLLQVTEPGDVVTTYTYDPIGNRVSMTDARGKTTVYTRDALGRLLHRTDAMGNVTTYSYDATGNPVNLKQPDGSLLTFTYDALNRLQEKKYPTGPPTVFTYDANGNRIQMTDKLGISSWSYNARNQLLNYTDPFGKEVHYSYDANGNRTEIVYPGNHSVAYAYDAGNRLASVTDWFGNQTNCQYDAAGNLLEILLPNGSTASYGYDNAAQLIALTNTGPGGNVINSYTYTLDPVGNQIGEERQEPLAVSLTAMNVSATYGNDNRIETVDGAAYSHDANGNRIAQVGSQPATFKYDADNHLIEFSNGAVVQYQYDGIGNRLSKTEDGTTTRYVMDMGVSAVNILAETDLSGAVSDYYVYGLGLLYKLLPNGTAYFYHYDSRGSTIALTDANGQLVNKYAYTPFGSIAASNKTISNPFCFVGRYGIMSEGAGIYYMRARYYDANTGRFLSKDIVKGNVLNPQTLNQYVYALDNPVMMIDISGLSAKEGNTLDNNYGTSDNLNTHKALINEGLNEAKFSGVNFGLSLTLKADIGAISVYDKLHGTNWSAPLKTVSKFLWGWKFNKAIKKIDMTMEKNYNSNIEILTSQDSISDAEYNKTVKQLQHESYYGAIGITAAGAQGMY